MLNIIRNRIFRTAGAAVVLFLASVGGAGAEAQCLEGGYGLDVDAILNVVPHPTEPDTLFVLQDQSATNGLSLVKSCDGGTTWSPTALTTDFYTVLRVAVDPTNPQTVYAATSRGDVVSTDGGLTWAETDIPGFSLVFAADGTLYSYDSGRIWRRLPGDTIWTETTPVPQGFNVLRVHPADSARLHVGQYYSVDGGVSWQRVRPQMVRDLRFSKTNPDRVIATATPLVLSDDGGVTWYEPTAAEFEVFSYGPAVAGTHVAFGATNSDTLWVATERCGVWQSVSSGFRWNLQDEGLTGGGDFCWLGSGYPEINRFEPSPVIVDRFYAVTADGLFVTNNSGDLWVAINGTQVAEPPAPPPNAFSGTADMTLDLFGLKNKFTPPTTLKFSGTIRNNGPDTAREVTLSIGAQIVSSSWGTCENGVCDFGDVPAGTSIAQEFERAVSTGGIGPQCTGDVFQMSGRVTATTNDPNAANNADSVSSVRQNNGALISRCPGEGLLQKESDKDGGGSFGGLMLTGLIVAAWMRQRRFRDSRDCQISPMHR